MCYGYALTSMWSGEGLGIDFKLIDSNSETVLNTQP